MLKTTFIELIKHYTDEPSVANELWDEIERKHSESHRHYHTLSHLNNLLHQLWEVKNRINDWNAILFTLYYHDSIYDVKQPDNEEKSAELAIKRMQQLGVSVEVVERVKDQILATKAHQLSTDSDVNYFLDADLSILGQDWKTYLEYSKNVRKEFSIYPDSIYIPGRKKVLNHFLEMDKIFKTEHFYDKFELPSKQNLQKEFDAIQ